MSKNLTRKGIALGAIVTLGASVFAGSPAFAAGELNVVPSAGTSYNAVAGSVFNLATTFAPGYTPSSYAQLKYLVKTDANSAITYDAGLAAVTAPATSQAVSLTSSAVSATATAATDVAYLGLKATDATVTSAVEVTAFVDANNNGALNAGEWNTVKTVTFKKAADIVPVVTLTQPNTGDTTVSATVAWGDLNIEQANRTTYLTTAGSTNSALGVQFNVAGAGYPAAAATGVSYSSSTGKFSATVSALASAATVAARAVYATNTFASSTNTYTATALGSAASATATARTINATGTGLVANVLKGNDAIATSATAIATNTAATVRVNGTFTAQVKALDSASTPAAVAGVAVTGTVALGAGITLRPATSTDSEISVTVNGTKYTSNSVLTAATLALTTDATGLASVVVSSTGVTAGSTATITVTFAAQNLSAAVVATQTAAAYTVSDDAASTIIATNKNAAATLNYSVKDQFGVLSARTNERLVVTATAASGTSPATQYIAVSGGKATFSVTPTTDNTADVVVAAALQVSTNTNGSISWATDGTNVADRTVKVRSAAYSFSTAPAVATVGGNAYNSTSNYKQALTTSAVADLGTPAAGAVFATVTLTGSNAGEKLTVSGSGVFLSIDAAAATADSASKVAQAASATIYVASNTTGAKTLTVTNGTVSATVVVTFGSAAATSGAAIAFGEATTSSQAGRSVDVTAIITDKFGNVVAGTGTNEAASISATGVGYLANTTTATDASGKIVAKLIVGAGETGDAVVTASFKMADGTTKSVVKTISFGTTDAQVDIVGNRVTAVASFSKGKTVAFYVDGVKKWSKLSASDADVVINYNLKKGAHTITVKISGGFVATEKFIVK